MHSHTRMQVLGPVALLLACERDDIADCLSSHLGSALHLWVTIREDDAQVGGSGQARTHGSPDHSL